MSLRGLNIMLKELPKEERQRVLQAALLQQVSYANFARHLVLLILLILVLLWFLWEVQG